MNIHKHIYMYIYGGARGVASRPEIPTLSMAHVVTAADVRAPKPQTPHPNPQTQNPQPQTPNPKPHTPHPTHETLNYQLKILNPKSQTLD